MIKLFVSPSCSSCRKVKQWMNDNGIEFEEKNIFSNKLNKEDIKEMVYLSDNGFEDIVSARSKIMMEGKIKLDDMSTDDAIKFIIDNPTILKRPIIIDKRKMQVGYNSEDIEAFLPLWLKEEMMKLCSPEFCDIYQDCEGEGCGHIVEK